MDKICLIKLPAGIGDIFFCQKIAKHIQQNTEYKKIYWPVKSVYSYIKEYIKNEDVYFCDENEDFPFKDIYVSDRKDIILNEDLYFLPLHAASQLGACSCHGSWQADGHMKYDLAQIKYDDWKDYLIFNRNYKKEKLLIEELGIEDGVKFNLINKNYGTYPNYLSRNGIVPQNEYKNIYMDFNFNYSLFDWIGVAEKAEEIHGVEGSFFYLLEKMNFSENVYVYSRLSHVGDNFTYMDGVLNKNWVYIN